MPRSMGMSMSRPTATGRRRPACGARSSTKPTRRAALRAATRFSSAAVSGRLPGGAGHHAAFRRLNGHRLGLSAICEDLPEEHNRVTLDPVLKDSHGIPAPKIAYTISDNTQRMPEHGIARATDIL